MGCGLWALGAVLLMSIPRGAAPQERGAVALGEAVQGLGVNTRVLVIGAHPDDEDTFLISWLSRGRHVETAYLSLTRGDGGQNLIGNELGEALGVLRTEELLAARRVDGALQYFTRAYDFGFSKDTIDTYAHWPKDSLLGDVVKVVRAFRPHVVVAVFSGTTRDGHGQHQVSGLLAREAYERSDDTRRFPTATHGAPWTALKFYRAARFSPAAATLSFNVGEYSPLLGRSYAEIAGESRSQHKSQGFGALQRKGPLLDYLRREGTRVNEGTPAATESSLLDGIDTTWARVRSAFREDREGAAIDSLPAALAAVRAAFAPLMPANLLPPLGRVQRLLESMCANVVSGPCARVELADARSGPTVLIPANAEVEASVSVLSERLNRAIQLAAGVEIEAFAQREGYPIGRTARVIVATHNRGSDTIAVLNSTNRPAGVLLVPTRRLAPANSLVDTVDIAIDAISLPWWLRAPRAGAMFTQSASTVSETKLDRQPAVAVTIGVAGLGPIEIVEPVVFRFADDVKGEVRRHIAGAPAITVTLDQGVQYAPANSDFSRLFDVRLRSTDDKPRDVRVTLRLPRGLVADTATRRVRLAPHDAEYAMTFRVRGRLPADEHRIEAIAESDGETFRMGYDLIDYEHIRRRRVYRPATTVLSTVDVRIPSALRVAYVMGVSDNIGPMLRQLGVDIRVIPAAEIGRADLRGYTTVVVGPRAYEAYPELVAANGRLLDFARNGGTLVVQYGQYEMTQPGIMPYPITISRPHDRVTHEEAPVAILEPVAPELNTPNRIGPQDFAGWVQERGLYMPRTFDERYHALLAMSDPGEQSNRGAILVAPLGRGMYVYTTVSFFRQLPAGVPGAARLFVNLLSAGIPASRGAATP